MTSVIVLTLSLLFLTLLRRRLPQTAQLSQPLPAPIHATPQRARLFCALVVGTIGVLGSVQTAAAQFSVITNTTSACIKAVSGFDVCTANDTKIVEFAVVSLIDGCTSPDDTFTALLKAKTVSTAATRYDIGLWVSLDGSSAITGNSCYRQILSPVAPNASAGDVPATAASLATVQPSGLDTATFPTLDLTGGNGPYRDEDGDMCGDIHKNESNFANLTPQTFSCRNVNNDGFALINACASWDNNAKEVCSSVEDALPGTPSKCRCGNLKVKVPVPNITVEKSCTPNQVLPGGSVRCNIKYTNHGGEAVSFRLLDDYDQRYGTVSDITTTSPGGNAGVDNGDVIAWLLPKIPKNGGGDVYYTYTVSPTTPGNLAIRNTATIYYGDKPVGKPDDETITTIPPSSITIRKESVPDGASSTFDFTSNTPPTAFSLSDNSEQRFGNLSAGSYTFGESVPEGWILTDITCTGATNSTVRIGVSGPFDPGDHDIAITLAQGEDLVCTFTNTQPGTIVVVKTTDPAESPQTFTFTPSYDDEFTLTDQQTFVSDPLLPGVYSVSEAAQSGWTQTGAICRDESSPVSITLRASQTVTCTFANTLQRGSIVVVKETTPPGASQVFTFSTDYSANFALSHGQSNSSGALLPTSEAGFYAVSELLPAGWSQTGVSCSDGSDPATIDLSPSETITCTFTNAQLPSALSIAKTAAATLVEPGMAVTYHYTVTNQGQTVLTGLTVGDDRCSPVTAVASGGFNPGDLNQNNALDLTEAWQYSCTTTLHADTLNSATASATTPTGSVVTDTAKVFVDVLPMVRVSKMADPLSVPETGAEVAFTIVVTNTSAETVTVTALSDSVFGNLSSDCPLPQSLAALNGVLTCTFSRLISGDFPDSHTNRVTAIGVDDEGNTASAEAEATVTLTDVLPSLTITKTASVASVPETGGTVIFTVTVVNTSREAITLTKLTDSIFADLSGQGTCSTPQALAADGGSYHCTFSQLLEGDIETPHENTVTGEAADDDGNTATAKDSATVAFTNVLSSMQATKRPSAATVPAAGGVITFTLLVENTSTHDTITLNSLQDDQLGTLSDADNPRLLHTTCTLPQSLPPGEMYTCAFSANLAGEPGIRHTNTVTTRGIDDDRDAVSTTAEADVLFVAPAVSATKRDALALDVDSNGIANPGDILTYTVTVRNSGNLTATAVLLNDRFDPTVQLVVGSTTTTQGQVVTGNTAGDGVVKVELGGLPPASEATIRFRVRIVDPLPAGVTKVTNQAIISGGNFPAVPTDDPDTETPDDATETPVGAAPKLAASKTDTLVIDADNNGVPSPGDTLEYRVVLVNSGNQTATDLLFDDMPDLHTTLLVGSVVANPGVVVTGNAVGDKAVQVTLATLAGGGSTAEIVFQVRINRPLPAGVTTIANQGLLTQPDQPVILTDDPETPSPNDPTRTPLRTEPRLQASKRATLASDADNNGIPSPGDTLLYNITIINDGNTAATEVLFTDTVDVNTRLVTGSVQTDRGEVVVGNRSGDSTVQVNIGTLTGGGDEVEISFQVHIVNPLPPEVDFVANQGIVRSQELPPQVTDDPKTETPNDPTVTTVVALPKLVVSKVDTLLVDADNIPGVSAGDSLLYRLTVQNIGNTAALDVVLNDTPDPNTTLITGTVETSLGRVTRGNSPGDRQVRIEVSNLPASEQVAITFQVRINPVKNLEQVINQAFVEFAIPGGQTTTIPSDDPDSSGTNDPTVTPVIRIPTALEETTEPTRRQLYFPVIER
jgi:uncharacterized repeat protein (TIGR01451 family)